MPRNFSELKSGGDNSYAVPHPEKWGGATRPPRPPPIDARASDIHAKMLFYKNWMWAVFRVLTYGTNVKLSTSNTTLSTSNTSR